MLKYGEYIEKLPDYDAFNEDYERISDGLIEKYMEKHKKGNLSLIEAEIQMQEETWDILKEKYNIDISFEKR